MISSERKIDLTLAAPSENKNTVSLSVIVKERNAHALATVVFDAAGNMVIEDGKAGKKALENAKRYTSVCYVRNSEKHIHERLNLIGGVWVRDLLDESRG